MFRVPWICMNCLEKAASDGTVRWSERESPRGKDALFPVSPELTDDVLDIVLVDEDVPVHDRLRGNTVLNACQDLLLVHLTICSWSWSTV